MQSKQDILNAIRQTAKENGGVSLGRDRFEKETGIKPYDWGKYWVRFGDAQKEAGFSANILNAAYSDEFLFKKIVDLIRKLGKFPIYKDINLERRSNDPELPWDKTFYRFGSKEGGIRGQIPFFLYSSEYFTIALHTDYAVNL